MAVDRHRVQELRDRVGDELSRNVADAEQRSGAVIAGEDRRMLARTIISREIDALDAEAINRGEAIATNHERDDLTRAVLNDLFALGRIQQHIDDPDISDIVINGHDTVWLTNRRGTKYRGEAVADNDDHLIEIPQLDAAEEERSGADEAR